MFVLQVDDEIRLRLLETDNAEALFALVDSNRQHLRRWLPWLDVNIAASDTADFIRSTQQQWEENSGFVAAIWIRGEIVGVGDKTGSIGRTERVGLVIGLRRDLKAKAS